jgi:Rod binding domain-containing protein
MSAPIQDSGAQIGARALATAEFGRDALSRDAAGRDAAQRLEGLFATLLVKEMRSTQSTGLFGEGTGADVYSGWFDQYLGDVLAKHGELHLAGSIQTSLASKEEVQP